jgi:uncharacterized protein
MQPSKYLKAFTHADREDSLLLFSTRYCSKLIIKRDTWEAAEHCSLPPEKEAVLSRLGMLVGNRGDEKVSVSGTFEELNKHNTSCNTIVVLNLDCNFACKYCFEGALKGRIYMSEETAADLTNFIRNRFDQNKKALHLDFYGGEPLLSLDLIREISIQLYRFAKEKNTSYTFGLVTNGSLLKGKTAEELTGIGLKSAKITLDGPAYIHNKNRPFKSGAESFDIIIKNIKESCGLLKITISGNYEQDSYRDFPLLLDLLIKEGLTPDRIAQVKFDPVIKNSERFRSPTDFNDGCMSMDEPWAMEAALFLREEILKRGFGTPGVSPSFCAVENNSYYTVNHDGHLYKCPGFLGMREFELGDLKNSLHNLPSPYGTAIWNRDECLECEYLPLCFGGCRLIKFLRDGDIQSPDCQRKYFDTCLERLVKQDIRYGIKAGK